MNSNYWLQQIFISQTNAKINPATILCAPWIVVNFCTFPQKFHNEFWIIQYFVLYTHTSVFDIWNSKHVPSSTHAWIILPRISISDPISVAYYIMCCAIAHTRSDTTHSEDGGIIIIYACAMSYFPLHYAQSYATTAASAFDTRPKRDFTREERTRFGADERGASVFDQVKLFIEPVMTAGQSW